MKQKKDYELAAVPAIKKYPAKSRIIDDLEINFS